MIINKKTKLVKVNMSRRKKIHMTMNQSSPMATVIAIMNKKNLNGFYQEQVVNLVTSLVSFMAAILLGFGPTGKQ